MRKTRRPVVWTFSVILLAPWLLGTTYKWVDPQGQVHFTDTLPPTGIAYEVIAAPHSPPAPAPAPAAPAPAAVHSSPAAATESSPPTVSDTAEALRNHARCVDALYQLQVLAGNWKVYRPGPGDDRTYLHDRDRPAEIDRLTRERDTTCSDEPGQLASQQRRARELFQSLSPDCREAREKLRNLQRPTARSAPSDVERQQAYLAEHCPGADRDDVWLADWRYPPRP
jgi:hypothetical protein